MSPTMSECAITGVLVKFDDDSFYGDMTKWVSEQYNEVSDDLCCAIETNSILLIHQLCTKWIQIFRQNHDFIDYGARKKVSPPDASAAWIKSVGEDS